MRGKIAIRSRLILWAAALLLLAGCGPRLQLPFEMEVGQHFDAVITKERRFSYDGDVVSSQRASLPVRIQVLEKNDKGFVTVWHHGCMGSEEIDSERAIIEQRLAGVSTGLLFFEGVDFNIQTDEFGRPWKLLNRFEVRGALGKRVETVQAEFDAITAAGAIDPVSAYNLSEILKRYKRFFIAEANLEVEMELLTEAILLTSFNGESLPLGGRERYSRERFNPFRAAPVSTSGHIAVTDLDEAAQRAWVEWSTEVEPESYKRSLAYLWPRLQAEPAKKRTRAWAKPEEIPDFDIRYFGLLDIDLATGLTRDAKLEARTTVENERHQTITRIVQQPASDTRLIPQAERSFTACRPRLQAALPEDARADRPGALAMLPLSRRRP